MTFFDLTRVGLLPARASDRQRVATRLRAAAWSRRTFLLATLCLVAVGALAFARWQIDGAVVPWDSKNQFYPFFRFLGDALRHGTLPFWNPYQFAGYPAVADPQSLIFTPSMMLFALVSPGASMATFDAVIMGHLVLGGIGMLGLARRWRWHPQAGVLAGIVYMLGGVAAARLQHTGMIISYAFFPLALWSLQAALDRRSLVLAVAAGLATTSMALGRDQVAFLLCLALVGAVARQAFRSGAILAYLRARTPVLAVATLVTVALMIVPILLTLQFLHDSNRPGIAFGMALEGSLDPINLVTMLAPNVFGSLDKIYDYWGPGAATVAGDDWTDRSIDYLFAGTLPVVLLVWHGVASGRLLERGARYFALLLVAATLYAMGRHTPIFALAFDWMPGVSLYRRPADATFLMNVALAFCVGYLLHRFIEEGLPRLSGAPVIGWLAPVLTAIAIALLIGATLAFARAADSLRGSLDELALSSSAALAVVGALLLFHRRRFRPAIAAVLVAATAGQVVRVNAASPLNAEPMSAYSAFAALYPDEARGLALLQGELARRQAAGEHPRVEMLGLDGSWQNAAMLYKLEDTLGYNPLRIAEYERAVGVGESANDPRLRSFPDTFRGYGSRLSALLGIAYLVLDRPIADMPRTFPRPRATLLFAGAGFFLYRLDTPTAPRVYVASSVTPIDSGQVVADGSLPPFEVGKSALLDQADIARLGDPNLVDGTTPDAEPASSARITRYADDAVAISVDATHAGLLVLHDIDYPGWTARVDGKPMPVLRANLLFRGVEVPAGHHTVEFGFHPLSMTNLTAAAESLWRGATH